MTVAWILITSPMVFAADTDIARSLQVDCARVLTPEVGTVAAVKAEVRGFVSTDTDLKRVQAFASTKGYALAVDVVPWPACEAMVTLASALAASDRPKVRTTSGRHDFKIREPLAFEITAPDYFSFLYAVYLQTDGTVVNLLPRGGPLRRQTPPGHKIELGSGKGSGPAFEAAAPAGAEAVIVIASRVPLRELEALDREGNRPYRLAFKSESKAKSQNQAFLDVLKTGLGTGPGIDKHSDISAAVFHLKIKD